MPRINKMSPTFIWISSYILHRNLVWTEKPQPPSLCEAGLNREIGPSDVNLISKDFQEVSINHRSHNPEESISTFHIRVDQAIQRDLKGISWSDIYKKQDENLQIHGAKSVGFWPLKKWKNWHQNIVFVLLDLVILSCSGLTCWTLQDLRIVR